MIPESSEKDPDAASADIPPRDVSPENSSPDLNAEIMDETALQELDQPFFEENADKHHASKHLDIPNPYKPPTDRIKSLLTSTQAARLPDGKQQIPLGSGIITGILGEGGMARVYRVWNQKLELFRAVKVIYPTESAELMERFETEIKISAKLHHPNIVETYIVGEWNGLPYIEMELVEGVSLETLIQKNGSIPPAICAAIGIQVASALEYAHSEEFLIYGRTYKGIIHRDLKPANIMISKNGVVKLMDFGIARPSEVHLHTVSGYIVGTLPYLSPEQLAESEIDHRSDIYSLGTILYEALTGEKTFPQQTVTNLMRMKVLHSYRKVDSYSIEVHPELRNAIEKCLRVDKKKRFESSKELVLTLKDIFQSISSEPINTILSKYIEKPSSFEIKTVPKRNIRKRSVIIGSALLLIVIIFIVWLLFPKSSSKVFTVDYPAPLDSISIKNNDTAQNRNESITDSAENIAHSSAIDTTGNLVDTAKSHQKSLNKVSNDTKKITTGSMISGQKHLSSPVDDLVKKYGITNLVDIADVAAKNGDWKSVITAVTNISSDEPQQEKALLLLALTYVEQRKISQAAQILSSFTSNDAFYTLLEGRIASIQNEEKLALKKFEEAMTRPGVVRSTQLIRSDALFYAAIIYDDRYNSTRSPESREQSLIAWNALKKAYISNPDHPRFKLANQKLSEF
ncbi:MAG TPA: serine/threonine-protein kinase [Chitinispirillaceae bacterium]|nr:serine/threonine-protein kinase [Chitinispirillaceae bacterium]